MSFFKFTGLAIAIDSCDVAIIAPRTVGLDTDCTVMMARGQTVLPALTPTEAATEVDATADGDPLMAGPYTTLELGAGCYFGGRQIQRVAPTSDGLGCVCTFGNVPAIITVPAVTVDDMLADLNATGECSAGGGGTGFSESGTHATAVTASAGTGATIGSAGPGPLGVSRVGVGPDAADGDSVVLSGGLLISGATDGATYDFTAPYPISPSPLPVCVFGTGIDTDMTMAFSLVDDTTIRFTATVDVDNTGGIPFALHYQVAPE